MKSSYKIFLNIQKAGVEILKTSSYETTKIVRPILHTSMVEKNVSYSDCLRCLYVFFPVSE